MHLQVQPHPHGRLDLTSTDLVLSQPTINISRIAMICNKHNYAWYVLTGSCKHNILCGSCGFAGEASSSSSPVLH